MCCAQFINFRPKPDRNSNPDPNYMQILQVAFHNLEITVERCYAPENPGAYISSIGYAPEYSGT